MAVSHIFSNAVADWTGTVTVFNSQGSTTSAVATNIVRPSDWNSAHNQFYTLTGNTLLNTTASGTNVVWGASGAGISIVGSTGSIIISSPGYVSSYENMPLLGSSTGQQTLNGASISHCVAFNIFQPISASFLRIPVLMTTNSTTLATTAATLSASVQIGSTWNAVVYSLGTGASSRSLISVASGSNGWTLMNSISVAVNGTQYSVTQAFSANAEGAGTTRTTQYSISNTNYSLSTNTIATEWSTARWLDVHFANSLSAGPYWLVFGYSTSSAANSTGISNGSNCNVRYSANYVGLQPNVAFGVMGTASTAALGAGSFSTAGGGTTSIFPISAISSSASNARPYFQLIRSA